MERRRSRKENEPSSQTSEVDQTFDEGLTAEEAFRYIAQVAMNPDMCRQLAEEILDGLDQYESSQETTAGSSDEETLTADEGSLSQDEGSLSQDEETLTWDEGTLSVYEDTFAVNERTLLEDLENKGLVIEDQKIKPDQLQQIVSLPSTNSDEIIPLIPPCHEIEESQNDESDSSCNGRLDLIENSSNPSDNEKLIDPNNVDK